MKIEIAEAHAFRLGQLTERIQLLQIRASLIAQEQRKILAEYGLDGMDVLVVTEAGDGYPVGTVLDAKTRLPLSVEEPHENRNGAAVPSAS